MINLLPEPDSPDAAPTSPEYVPGPEEPEQALLLPDYPYLRATLLTRIPRRTLRMVQVTIPNRWKVDGEDDDSSDNDEEEEASEEEEEEHLAPADSVVAPVVDHVSSFEETEPFETG
ncbi:hypothetical protein Tco_0413375 [Tanacetum coccineum]